MRSIKKAKRRIKNRELAILLWNTLLEMLNGIKHTVIEELGKIAVIIEVLIPVLLMKMNMGTTKTIIVSCLLIMLVRYIKEIGYKLNKTTERGFPIPSEPMIERDENGFVSIVEGKEQEAILYLDDVQEYLKSKGWL